MKGKVASIPFAGSILGAYRHVCAFCHTADEEYLGAASLLSSTGLSVVTGLSCRR
jgi:hypothetical protein